MTESEQLQTVEQYFSIVNPDIDYDDLALMGKEMASDYFKLFHDKEEYNIGYYGKIKDVLIGSLQLQ